MPRDGCRRDASSGQPLAPRTAELYRDLLDRHIEPVFGAVALSQVRPDTVRAWHADLAARVSPLQAAKAYRLFRGILKTAVDDGRTMATRWTRLRQRPGNGGSRLTWTFERAGDGNRTRVLSLGS